MRKETEVGWLHPNGKQEARREVLSPAAFKGPTGLFLSLINPLHGAGSDSSDGAC